MSLEDNQIIADFVVESREHLADIENQLLQIEAGGENVDTALVNEVFRAVHSVKGASGFLGFSVLGRLAHELESVLNLIRNSQLVPTSTHTDIMLRAADTLRNMVEDIENSNDVDITGHEAELQAVVGEATNQQPAPSADAGTATITEAAAPQTAAESDAQSHVKPTAESSSPDRVEASPAPSPSTGAPAADGATQSAPPRAPASSAPTSIETNIRVSVSVLDRLMNLAGELVLARNQLLQTINSSTHNNLDSVAARVDQITSELQETIMQTRMQTVATVFNKFPRVVRDLSHQLNKKCRLVLEGEEVELDKSIIEAIGDPLTHLIRNAVDHGLETAEARQASGKPEQGTIYLRAFHQAGKVNLSIADDGRGIDAARLREKAVSRGLITPEQAREMGDRESLRLIFRPGFSMAEKVTGVSGRGVGMDVVKTNIEKLGGTVDISTELEAGTTIDIKLPLTLAIIPSLVVCCGNRRFAIPQANIGELVRIKPEEVSRKIECINDAEVFRLRGNLLPLVRLNRALDLDAAHELDGDSSGIAGPGPENAKSTATHIIVVEAGHLRYGLVVDGLHDSEEIVVKPLGRHMQQCPCLAGATILGDGEVALILDVAGIAAYTRLRLSEEETTDDEREAAATMHEDRQLVLLFKNHPNESFAIPMELIARIERIRAVQIDSVGGQEVLQYRGGSLPLLALEHYVQAQPRQSGDQVHVVVFNMARREIGLIVPELIDIRAIELEVDTTTFRERGISGSVVVDNKTTRLLDLYELTSLAHPEWFQTPPPADEPQRIPRILLAEDSTFFRQQLVAFLEEAGYEVVACEDGQIAWDRLAEDPQSFDLIVTDLEMPNMDGLEFASRVKTTSATCHLPVVAVTSLATDEDVRRGEEAGVDEYHVKLDREQLMLCVERYLHNPSLFDAASHTSDTPHATEICS